MKVVGLERLQRFRERHADVRSQVDAWLCEVEDAKWKSPQDIKERYPHASILAENRVIFNLKGNNYRIYTKVNYEHQLVLVVRAGTHAEYSKWKL